MAVEVVASASGCTEHTRDPGVSAQQLPRNFPLLVCYGIPDDKLIRPPIRVAEEDTAVAGVENAPAAVVGLGRSEGGGRVGTKRATGSPPSLRWQTKPSKGGMPWNWRNLRWKPSSETSRHQGLQTRTARTRLAGSSGGNRTRIFSGSAGGRRGGGSIGPSSRTAAGGRRGGDGLVDLESGEDPSRSERLRRRKSEPLAGCGVGFGWFAK